MRVIAGMLKGRKLLSPEGQNTRPTPDRVKESLFAILQPNIQDSYVLDLFAGTGGLGIEALSRGASFAVFVDKDRTSMNILRENISTLNLECSSKLMHMDYRSALTALKRESRTFDIVLIDPPYKMEQEEIIDMCFEHGVVASDGVIVVEHDAKKAIESKSYVVRDSRKYGNTALSFIVEHEL